MGTTFSQVYLTIKRDEAGKVVRLYLDGTLEDSEAEAVAAALVDGRGRFRLGAGAACSAGKDGKILPQWRDGRWVCGKSEVIRLFAEVEESGVNNAR